MIKILKKNMGSHQCPLHFLALIFIFFLGILKADNFDYIYSSSLHRLNNFGQNGIINLPSAKAKNEGSMSFVYSTNAAYKFGALTISPFDWLSGTYFYYRPSDITGGGLLLGDYLDKGFSVQFSSKLSPSLNLSLGLDDFAGTGKFSREYLVLTQDSHDFLVSIGLLWAYDNFLESSLIDNPLSILTNEFKVRPRDPTSAQGGSPAYNQWFRGDSAIFFGLEYSFKGIFKDFRLKFETDPFNYNFFSGIGLSGPGNITRAKHNNYNYGLSFAINDSINLHYQKIGGIYDNISITLRSNFLRDPFNKRIIKAVTYKKSKKSNDVKQSFYEDLILNINERQVFLQTAELTEDGTMHVAVSSNKYRNPVHVHAVVGDMVELISRDYDLEINKVNTININVGHELHNISSSKEIFSKRNNFPIELAAYDSQVTTGQGDQYSDLEFRPIIKYPASFTGVAPALVNHIGDPVKFYFGGLVLRLDNEIQFSSRLQLNTEIYKKLINNFDDKRNFPDSLLPKVRTDIVSYLQQSDLYIARMQLDYFFNPRREIFGKFSAGILEDMYAGAGVEFLYKPFEHNFSIGFEAYHAKKRDFDRMFKLSEYKSNTGHINFNYHLPRWGILGTLSYGQYLAGDRGYTFDISRRLASGFRAGIFFTRTNVSAALFGEGSFDKGFYFQIPIDLFLNDYRGGYINFKLRPLTRDGGQKLEAGNELIGIMHNTSRAEIERDWSSFND